MADYEKEYQKGLGVCGEPFPEFVEFVGTCDQHLRVLDLGCGQGRDAIMIARRGHHVVGVDQSPTGIAQMAEAASREGLAIEGVVADILTYHPEGEYDIVVFDRVLHMLGSDEQRQRMLHRAMGAAVPGGYLLIADTPSHLSMIRQCIVADRAWTVSLEKRNLVFGHRLRPPELR